MEKIARLNTVGPIERPKRIKIPAPTDDTFNSMLSLQKRLQIAHCKLIYVDLFVSGIDVNILQFNPRIGGAYPLSACGWRTVSRPDGRDGQGA
jgi:hypothetical protein